MKFDCFVLESYLKLGKENLSVCVERDDRVRRTYSELEFRVLGIWGLGEGSDTKVDFFFCREELR